MTTATAFVCLPDVAASLGLPRSWLKAEADAGRIPAIRTEKSFLVVPEAVEAVLAGRAGNPAERIDSGSAVTPASTHLAVTIYESDRPPEA